MTDKNGNNKINTTRDRLLRYSAILGSTGVSLGAFGAHALKKMVLASSSFSSSDRYLSSLQDNWRTAVQYQLFHTAALLALSSLTHSVHQHEQQHTLENKKMSSRRLDQHNKDDDDESNIKDASTIQTLEKIEMSGKMMFYGTMLFSGSIYCLTLGIGPKKIIGPITPLGGLCMIGGWIVVGMITIS